MIPHLFCFGLGYVGAILALTAQKHGWRVSGTTRIPERAAHFQERGIHALPFEDTDKTGDVRESLTRATHIFSTIPPLSDGRDPVFPLLLNAPLKPTLQWLGYLSTVGVYGNAQGDIVSENTPLAPLHTEAKAQAFIEADWRSLHSTFAYPVHIFRMSGVYGSERNPLERIQEHPAPLIIKKGLYCCRIHIDDVIMALLASMQNPKPGALYNLSDDEPAPPQDVTAYAYRLLGLDPPDPVPYDPATLPEMVRVHYEESRRVSAEHIKQDLGIAWQFPSYREGLTHIFDQVKAQP